MDMSSYKVEPHHHHDKLFSKEKEKQTATLIQKEGGDP
jgi:hypothetical protein